MCGLHSPEKFQTSIFQDLIAVLEQEGFVFTKELSCANIIMMCDYSDAEFENLKKFESKFKVLLRLEARSILPIQHRKRIEHRFDLIFDLGTSPKVQSGRIFQLPFPYSFSENPIGDPFHEIDLSSRIEFWEKSINSFYTWCYRPHEMVMICSNKESHNIRNNYRLRRAVLKRNEQIVLFGTLWNQSFLEILKNRFWIMRQGLLHLTFTNYLYILGGSLRRVHSYRGQIENKSDILLNSKFNLVIENGNESLTEKVFDALICGAIPIYFGPNLEGFNFPTNLVFQVHSKSELLAIVKNPPVISREFFDIWSQLRADFMMELIEVQGKFNPRSVFFNISCILKERFTNILYKS